MKEFNELLEESLEGGKIENQEFKSYYRN